MHYPDTPASQYLSTHGLPEITFRGTDGLWDPMYLIEVSANLLRDAIRLNPGGVFNSATAELDKALAAVDKGDGTPQAWLTAIKKWMEFLQAGRQDSDKDPLSVPIRPSRTHGTTLWRNVLRYTVAPKSTYPSMTGGHVLPEHLKMYHLGSEVPIKFDVLGRIDLREYVGTPVVIVRDTPKQLPHWDISIGADGGIDLGKLLEVCRWVLLATMDSGGIKGEAPQECSQVSPYTHAQWLLESGPPTRYGALPIPDGYPGGWYTGDPKIKGTQDLTIISPMYAVFRDPSGAGMPLGQTDVNYSLQSPDYVYGVDKVRQPNWDSRIPLGVGNTPPKQRLLYSDTGEAPIQMEGVSVGRPRSLQGIRFLRQGADPTPTELIVQSGNVQQSMVSIHWEVVSTLPDDPNIYDLWGVTGTALIQFKGPMIQPVHGTTVYLRYGDQYLQGTWEVPENVVVPTRVEFYNVLGNQGPLNVATDDAAGTSGSLDGVAGYVTHIAERILEIQKTNLKYTLTQLEARIVALGSEKALLQKELAAKIKELEEATRSHQESEGDLQRDLENLRVRLQSVQAEISQLETRLRTTTSALTSAQAARNQALDDLDQARTTHAQEIQSKEEQIQALRDQLNQGGGGGATPYGEMPYYRQSWDTEDPIKPTGLNYESPDGYSPAHKFSMAGGAVRSAVDGQDWSLAFMRDIANPTQVKPFMYTETDQAQPLRTYILPSTESDGEAAVYPLFDTDKVTMDSLGYEDPLSSFIRNFNNPSSSERITPVQIHEQLRNRRMVLRQVTFKESADNVVNTGAPIRTIPMSIMSIITPLELT